MNLYTFDNIVKTHAVKMVFVAVSLLFSTSVFAESVADHDCNDGRCSQYVVSNDNAHQHDRNCQHHDNNDYNHHHNGDCNHHSNDDNHHHNGDCNHYDNEDSNYRHNSECRHHDSDGGNHHGNCHHNQ